MSPQFVKPYVKGNKNDANDAGAICEAVGRPNMRFVPVKSVESQDILALHRVRGGLVKERTAQARVGWGDEGTPTFRGGRSALGFLRYPNLPMITPSYSTIGP